MKQLLGLILIILAIPMTLYVALWLCFIGGVVQIIAAIKATPIDSLAFAMGLCRFFCTGLAGWFTFFILLLPGFGLLLSKTRTRFHN
jgi:hypothetical protein